MMIFIAAVQAAVQLHVRNAVRMIAQWTCAAPALHMHRFCSAQACGVKRALMIQNISLRQHY